MIGSNFFTYDSSPSFEEMEQNRLYVIKTEQEREIKLLLYKIKKAKQKLTQ